MEEKVTEFKKALEEVFGEGHVIVEELEPDMIAVPEDRYKELLRKEVELDLLYAYRQKAHNYEFDAFIDTLINIRFPATEDPGNAE